MDEREQIRSPKMANLLTDLKSQLPTFNPQHELTAERDRLRAELAAERDKMVRLHQAIETHSKSLTEHSESLLVRGQQLTSANDTIAGLREALEEVKKLKKQTRYREIPHTMSSMVGQEHCEIRRIVGLVETALARTPLQHRKAIEAGALRRIDEQIARERDSYILAFGSLDAEDVLKIIRAEAERLEKEAGNG